MTLPRLQTLICAMLMASGAMAQQPAALEYSVKPEGGRLFDQLTYRGRPILRAADAKPGGVIRLSRAGDGSLDSLFRHDAVLELSPSVDSVTNEADAVRVVGKYTAGAVAIPFTRTIKRVGNVAISVVEETDFRQLEAAYRVASHQLRLPVSMHAEEHQRMLAFAGTHRVELFRMNMNDVSRREFNISDNRGFIPYWDIGGVLQLPTGYTVWKANHADTMAYPVESGDTAPGWADYSEDDWGVSVQVIDPRAVAPWSVMIDARAGDLSIYPYPPSQPARAGTELGLRKIQFQLHFHESSWPVFYPCELEPSTYLELLAYLQKKGEPQVTGALSTKDLPKGMVRERVQPSIVLRAMYRGDDWRMGSILKDIGEPDFKRGGPMEEREARANRFLDWVKANGVPTTAPK